MSTWRRLDPQVGLWTYDKLVGEIVEVRAVAVRLVDDGLLIVSPVRRAMPDTAEALRQLGEPRWLLAPNHFHNLGIASHLECFPDARVVASARASTRLAKKVDVPIAPMSELLQALPDHVRVLEPQGTRNGEVWLRVQTPRGVAWVVSDAFFNFARTLPGWIGWMMGAFGNSPGLRIGGTFKWIALQDRQRYGSWLRQQLATDPPDILIPGHGAIVEDPDLAQRLRQLADTRLPS